MTYSKNNIELRQAAYQTMSLDFFVEFLRMICKYLVRDLKKICVLFCILYLTAELSLEKLTSNHCI